MPQVQVYLAGGLKTDWQDRVLAEFAGDPRVAFFDPRTVSPSGGGRMCEVARAERRALRGAHLVFAYAEKTNAAPIGLAAELGYLVGLDLGKTPFSADDHLVVLVDELGTRGMEWLRHFAMAEHYTHRFIDGIATLRRLIDETWAELSLREAAA